MVRLTLLSSRDAVLAARVVDSGGQPFVLDFGDREVIAAVRRQLQHGFSLQRDGKIDNIPANAPDILACLASHYAANGLLVFFEEPTWVGRQGAEPSADDLEDDETELVSVDDLPDVGHVMDTVYPPDELDGPPGDASWATSAPSTWRDGLPAALVDVPDVGEHMRTIYPDDELLDELGLDDVGGEDLPTEHASAPGLTDAPSSDED